MPSATLNIASRAALQAGRIILQYIDRVDKLEIIHKAPHDVSTQVDHMAEKAIIETLQQAYPHHTILAEESANNTQWIDIDDESVWVIDPLDGTANYVHGLPHFAVSIAFQKCQQLQCAVIFDPMRNELFTAEYGQGSYLNHRRIRVSSQKHLNGSFLGTGFPTRYPHLIPPYLETFNTLLTRAMGIRRAGAAALDLAYVACGRLDGFWEFALNSWDMAAGILLVQSAGGQVRDCLGGEQYLQKGHIVAGNPILSKEILEALQPCIAAAKIL